MSEELKTRLLVVDDEQSIRRLCMTIGNTLGYACTEAESAEAALARLEVEAPDLILTDLKLPSMSGVELLKQTKTLLPHTEVAIMTGHGSIESAVDAMKLGAYDYIEKPFRVGSSSAWRKRFAWSQKTSFYVTESQPKKTSTESSETPRTFRMCCV
jgi:DNA-binding NtrC family response regulator